ncbi:predicted protein [Chaetoceros tenuissimus]|uniref:Uncharacterized protein n=1 Tax=Chaetoceros tenuissimus TaxID=426638 RepID=A0AAD3H3P0_9STRA|nr:predicted protein [Chaetoceros tenuissimus]
MSYLSKMKQNSKSASKPASAVSLGARQTARPAATSSERLLSSSGVGFGGKLDHGGGLLSEAILNADTFRKYEQFESGSVDRSFCGVEIGTKGNVACGRSLVRGVCPVKSHKRQPSVLKDGYLYPWYNTNKTRVSSDLGVPMEVVMADSELCKAVCKGVGSTGLDLTRKVFGVCVEAVNDSWKEEEMIATAWTIIKEEWKGKSNMFKTPAKAPPSEDEVRELTDLMDEVGLEESLLGKDSPMSARGIGARLVGATLVADEDSDLDVEDEEEGGYTNLGDPFQKALYDHAEKVQGYFRETGLHLNSIDEELKSVASKLSHLVVSTNLRLGTDPGLDEDGGMFLDIWTAIESTISNAKSLKENIVQTTDRLNLGEVGMPSPDGGSLRVIPDLLPDPSDAGFPFLPPSTFFANVIECVGFTGDYFAWSDGSPTTTAQSNSSSEVADLKVLVESLQRELEEVKARVDLSHVITVGGLEFRGVEDVLVFLERIDATAKLPASLYGLCYDMWHVMDRIAPGSDQKTETDRNKDQEVKSKLNVTSSMSRLQYSQTRDIPLLFVGQRQHLGNDEKAPIKPLASRSTWTSHSGSTGRKQQGEKSFHNVSVAFNQELRQLLQKSDHMELQTFFRTMFNQSVTHLHSFYNFMDHIYDAESALVGEEEAWIFT